MVFPSRTHALAAIVSASVVLAGQSAQADLIYGESFEGGLQGSTAIINGGNNGTSDFWSVLPSGSLNIGYTVLGVNGSSYFGFRDINGAWGGGNPRALEIQGLDISGYTNIQVTLGLSSRKDGSTNFEAHDVLYIKADSGAGFVTLDSFSGSGGSSGPFNTGIKNGLGDELTKTLTDFTYGIADGALLTFRIDAQNFDNTNEAVAIDNIRITGDLVQEPVGVAEPGTLTILAAGLLGLGVARRRKKV